MPVNSIQKGGASGTATNSSSTFEYENPNKFTTLDSSKSKYVVNQSTRLYANEKPVKVNNYTVDDDVS
jgi:hypothetical protein